MKIFELLYYLKERIKDKKIEQPTQSVKTSQESLTNLGKTFEAQAEQMQMRAMAAHEKDCPMISCGGCFVRIPDKIVGKPKIVPRKTNEQREKELSDYNKIRGNVCDFQAFKEKFEADLKVIKDRKYKMQKRLKIKKSSLNEY